METAPGFFTMMASGQLESAEVSSATTAAAQHQAQLTGPAAVAAVTQIPGCQTAYCKFEVVAGEDWQILDGMDNGITQVARQSAGVLQQSCRRCIIAEQSSNCLLHPGLRTSEAAVLLLLC